MMPVLYTRRTSAPILDGTPTCPRAFSDTKLLHWCNIGSGSYAISPILVDFRFRADIAPPRPGHVWPYYLGTVGLLNIERIAAAHVYVYPAKQPRWHLCSSLMGHSRSRRLKHTSNLETQQATLALLVSPFRGSPRWTYMNIVPSSLA
uniref:Protein kinase domain-containing protein n=1 Tax=Panagrellus redivivus TaxID=6233 RepID=A0A7E4VU27_PANRE